MRKKDEKKEDALKKQFELKQKALEGDLAVEATPAPADATP